MNFLLTSRQKKIQNKARDFVLSEITPYITSIENNDSFPSDIVMKLSKAGLMGLPIPKIWGGSGCDFLSYILALEELSKASATIGVILAVHTSVSTIPILRHGTDDQRKRYVIPMASGKLLGAFALTESSAGSDASKIQTTAVKHGDTYLLNGQKIFITNLGVANVYVVFAVTDPDLGIDGISAFILQQDMPGLGFGRLEKKMGLAGSNTGELILNNVEVPANNLLGFEGHGYKIALANLAAGRIGIAAQAIGIAGAAIDILKKEFRKSSSIIARDRFSNMVTRLEAAKLLVYRSAVAKEEGRDLRKLAAMTKMFASDSAMQITAEAIDLLGTTSGSLLYRLFCDAKVTQIYEGTNEIQRIIIAKELLK